MINKEHTKMLFVLIIIIIVVVVVVNALIVAIVISVRCRPFVVVVVVVYCYSFIPFFHVNMKIESEWITAVKLHTNTSDISFVEFCFLKALLFSSTTWDI